MFVLDSRYFKYTDFAMPKIKLISQEKATECGIACIAMLGRMSLLAARKSVSLPNQRNQRTSKFEIQAVLSSLGITVGRKVKNSDWSKLDASANVSLAAVNWRLNKQGEEIWHWLVYDNTGPKPRILDPKKLGERFSPGNTKLAWYHHVLYPTQADKS